MSDHSSYQRAGLCWFQPDQWEQLKAMAEDADLLEATWEEWEAKSLEMIDVFATRGILIEPVRVDIDTLVQWCHERDKPINASTRAEYVTAVMMEQRKMLINSPTQH